MSTTSDTATALIPAVAELVPSIPAHEIPTVRPIPLPADAQTLARQSRLRSDLLRMAHELIDDPTFGGEGNLIGGVQEVDLARIWRPERFDPIRYSEEEIDARAKAIEAAGFMTDEPVILVKSVNPAPVKRGMERANLMIVGNALTWEAAMRLPNMRTVAAIIKEKMSLFHAMTSIAQGFTLRHSPSALERGRLTLRLVLSYAITREQQPELDLPKLTQRFIADLMGLSQETVSHDMALAKLDDDLLDHIDEGHLPVGHAMEIRYAPPQAQAALAQEVIAAEMAGEPMTRDETRDRAQQERTIAGLPPKRNSNPSHPPKKRVTPPWMDSQIIRPPKTEELIFQDVFEYTPPEIFCAHIHDAFVWGERFEIALRNANQSIPPALKAFMGLRNDPGFAAELSRYVKSLVDRSAQNSRGD
jgi:hypothetical protein